VIRRLSFASNAVGLPTGSQNEHRAASRQQLEEALDRRDRLEGERDQLASNLCALLGQLRDAARETERLCAGESAESVHLQAALGDLEQFLAIGPSDQGASGTGTSPRH